MSTAAFRAKARRDGTAVRAVALPAPADQVPDLDALDALAAEVEAGFTDGAQSAVHAAHIAGVPVAVLDGAGGVAWLEPDGTVRPSRMMDVPVPHSR